jgi:hypothetical protein
MKIDTKYSFEDVVWKIGYECPAVSVPCGFCGAKGRVTGADGKSRMCPECYGRCGHTEHRPQEWLVKGQLTIGQVGVKITGEYKADQDSMFDNYGSQKYERKEEYMCRETGIRSGSIHYVETLWPTKEEAQAECDRLNAEKAKKDAEKAA